MTEKLLLNINEASDALGISKGLMYQLIRENKIPALKLGSLKVRVSDLESFVNNMDKANE